MADVLSEGRATLDEVVMPTQTPRIDVAPATIDLAMTEGELFNVFGREQVLREALEGRIEERYDFVLIDCPPNLGLLTVNGLVAANSVIIPVQTQYYAMKGLNNLVKVIQTIRHRLNRNLRILGLLPTFYDGRTLLARDMLDELRGVGDHHVFDSIVRQTVKLGEAPIAGRPITTLCRSVGSREDVPRTRAGGDRTWPDLISALLPRAASPKSRNSPRRSSACCRPTRQRARRSSEPIPLDHIEPNPEQPRLAFDQTSLDELAASIREHGVLQPILVRPTGRPALPADRRRAALARVARTRASRTIPAMVEEIDDDTALEIAIIENLQREDLSPLDEAAMYDRMIRDHGYSIRKLAEKLGKDKGYLENRLRLADAPPEIRELVSLRKDTLSHAYELLKVEDERKRRQARGPGRSRRAVARPAAREDRGTPARDRRRENDVDPEAEAAAADRRRRARAGYEATPTRARSGTTRSSRRSSSWPTRSRRWRGALAARGHGFDRRRRPSEPREVPDDRKAEARERDRDRPPRLTRSRRAQDGLALGRTRSCDRALAIARDRSPARERARLGERGDPPRGDQRRPRRLELPRPPRRTCPSSPAAPRRRARRSRCPPTADDHAPARRRRTRQARPRAAIATPACSAAIDGQRAAPADLPRRRVHARLAWSRSEIGQLVPERQGRSRGDCGGHEHHEGARDRPGRADPRIDRQQRDARAANGSQAQPVPFSRRS